MRPNYDDAVLRRADMASLQVWTQTALRIVLAIALLWALITTALVWYWIGYYGGPPAHEYFERWVLAWFFTEIIPLPFGSIPYKGRRYTIDGMYRYVSWKYYFGGSFAGWFWHYAPWGALLTLCLVGLLLLAIFPPPRRGRGERYIRGTDVIPTRRLARELASDGISIGEMPTPRRQESQHFLISGAPGTGKSTVIRSILRQVAQRREIAVVLDPECEYVPEFYRPELQRLRRIDYGYASTSHSSQGATVDRVIVNIDTLRSIELVNRKQFYVSISRARDGLTIYTDDREALRHAVNRNREKSVALEHARIRIQTELKQSPEIQRRTTSHSHGIGR